jgi:putative sterol carrier protein
MYDFGTEGWVKALMEAINASAGYADAAKTWEGDFYFIIEPQAPGGKETAMYFDLWHGKCREAYLVAARPRRLPL